MRKMAQMRCNWQIFRGVVERLTLAEVRMAPCPSKTARIREEEQKVQLVPLVTVVNLSNRKSSCEHMTSNSKLASKIGIAIWSLPRIR